MKHNYDFPMAGNTATMVLYTLWYKKPIEVLLGLRKKDSDAFPDRWSLPGGYLNVGTEIMLQVASRETLEETGLDINTNRWHIFFVDDKIGSDPRYIQVINLCYSAFVSKPEYNSVVAGDDLQEVKWTVLDEALKIDLPFNHNEILKKFDIYMKNAYDI